MIVDLQIKTKIRFIQFYTLLFCFDALLGGVKIVDEFLSGELNEDGLVDKSFSFVELFEPLFVLLSLLPLRSAKTC